MEVEPKSISFREVRLNQAYTTSLCISNPLPAAVEFAIRTSSPRYTVSPNRVLLSAGQSIIITVRLFLSHYPNFSKGSQGQDDTIHIKSSYFDQKINVTFFLHSRDYPLKEKRIPQAESSHDVIFELQSQLSAKEAKIKSLDETVRLLESKYPSVQQIIANRLEQERQVFEEKSEKVCEFASCFCGNCFQLSDRTGAEDSPSKGRIDQDTTVATR